MATIDLYDILDVKRDCDQNDIKKAYNTLVKIYHPDKSTGNAEMYEIIKHAYEILYDLEKRKEYDNLFEMSKYCNSDHFDLKKQSEEYIQHLKLNADTFENKKKEFDQYNEECGNTEQEDLTLEEFNRKLDTYKLAREQDDCECVPEKLFPDNKIDINKFNAAFDKSYKNELVVRQDVPSPWIQSDLYGDFQSQPFQEHISADLFNSIDPEQEQKVPEISIKDRLAARQKETDDLKNMKLNDFKSDIYGVAIPQDSLNNLDEIKTRYQRLLKRS